MYCEKCQENQANFQVRMAVQGHRYEVNLCSGCYKEERTKLGAAMNSFNNGQTPFEAFGEIHLIIMNKSKKVRNKGKAAVCLNNLAETLQTQRKLG